MNDFTHTFIVFSVFMKRTMTVIKSLLREKHDH